MAAYDHKELFEQMEAENFQLVQFERLGVDSIVAFEALQDGLNWHDLEIFLKLHPSCEPNLAVRILH